MEIYNPEKPEPKIFLPEVEKILASDPYYQSALEELEKIGKHKDTLRHSCRMTNLGYLFANYLSEAEPELVSRQDIRNFVEMNLLHDIGKKEIDPDVLDKQWDEFGPEDLQIVSKHARNGYLIVLEAGREMNIANPILLHHEFQGERSYPEIDVEAASLEEKDVDFARLLAMVDIFDTCAFGRSNWPPISLEKTKTILSEKFNLPEDEGRITFLMDAYKTIKDLDKN